jgi:hypothetical protein
MKWADMHTSKMVAIQFKAWQSQGHWFLYFNTDVDDDDVLIRLVMIF